MKLIFAVYDAAIQAFATPFFMNTKGEAMRSFTDEANNRDPNSAIAKHPEDYEIYHLGEYDEQTGKITQAENERLARAKDLIKPEH